MEFVSSMIFGMIAILFLSALICTPVWALWLIYVNNKKPPTRVVSRGTFYCLGFSLLVFCIIGFRLTGKYIMDDEILSAASNGDTRTVEFALWMGVDVDEQFKGDGPTPLIAAAENGHTETVKVLLSHHPDVNIDGGYGPNGHSTALGMAIAKNHPDIVRLLRDAGAK